MGRAKTASGAPRYPFSSPLAREGADGQAVVCPLLRGRSPTRGVAPKQHRVAALTLSLGLTRARGRCWPGRGLPVATGSLANERGRAQTASGGGRVNLISRPYARARALLA